MKIAIASGKGGTGKTTIAVSLALALSHEGYQTQYLDCDVEEPNGHIFLKPNIDTTEEIKLPVPQVDSSKCTHCGKCAQLCQFKAIAAFKETVLVFDQLCHSCGGCKMVCLSDAIDWKYDPIGTVEIGTSDTLHFVQGRLTIGNVRTPALIKAVKTMITDDAISILDSPPGTSCPVVATIRDADAVVLVTEPTPFGLNDLKLAVDLTRELNKVFAVIINQSGIGDGEVHKYCIKEGIPILLEIPHLLAVAQAYSTGKPLIEVMPYYRKEFVNLYKQIQSLVQIRKKD